MALRALAVGLALSVIGFAPPAAAQDQAGIVVAGGTSAVSDAVVADATARTGEDAVRLAGADRFETAAAVADAFAPGGPVVIASGEVFADALSGGPLAAVQGAPILLVSRESIPAATDAALTTLSPSSITIIGGTAVIDGSVEESLADRTDGPVTRLAGPDRFATAAAVASTFTAPVDAVYVASGEAFPDALSGAAAAGTQGVPVLLTRPGDLPDATVDALQSLAPQRIVVLGGTAAIAEDVAVALAGYTDGEVTRLAGADRYGTAAAVAMSLYPEGADQVYLASGADFPDALSIGPVAAGAAAGGFAQADAFGPGPLLLVGDPLTTETADALVDLLGEGEDPVVDPAEENRPPTVLDIEVDGSATTPVDIALLGSDLDGDPLTYAVVSAPDRGGVSVADDIATYTPAAGPAYTTTFTYTASDGALTSAAGTVTIAVPAAVGGGGPGNAAPVVDLDPAGPDSPDIDAGTFTEDGAPLPLVDAAAATVGDPDSADLRSVTATLDAVPDTTGEVLAASVATTTLTVTYNPVTGILELTPTAPDTTAPESEFQTALRTLTYQNTDDDPTAGPRTVTVRATDPGSVTSAPAEATLTVLPVNDPPTAITLTPDTIGENQPAGSTVGLLSAMDPDHATHDFDLVSGVGDTDNAAFAISGTQLQTLVALDFATTPIYSVRVQADDLAAGGTFAEPVTITVTDVNDVPSFALPAVANRTVAEDAGEQTVSAFASGISAGPANEAGQTLTFAVTNDENALFAVQPDIDEATGALTYTPAADASGVASVSVVLSDSGGTADGGVDTSQPQTFFITVTPVNDVPSFALPVAPDQTVAEDAAAQNVSPFATSISPGPADETGQVLSFDVTATDLTLFSVQPGIDASTGALTYTAAPDAAGTTLVSVTLTDDGQTNGADDFRTSAPQTFSITITAVNDAPVFTLPGSPDQAVLEDVGPQTRGGFASGIAAGPPNEAGQVRTFAVSNDDTALFSGQPDIDEATGDLTYTPAPDAFGSALVTVALTDDGGTAGGGDDTATPQTFTITVGPVNDAPTFTLGANQSVVADQPPQTVPGFLTALSAGPANEVPPQVIATLTTVADTSGLFTAGGLPAIDQATGTLTYTPNPAGDGTAIVTVTATDDGGVANGGVDTTSKTFTIQVVPPNATPTADSASATLLEDAAAAVTLSGSDSDGDPLTFAISSSPSKGTLGAIGPVSCSGAVPNVCTATVAYSPTADLNGADQFAYTASDGPATSTHAIAAVTITAVNDAPTFTVGADQSVAEDSGAQTVSPWATGPSAGPADEAGQVLTFTVTGNTAPALFAAGPAVDSDGVLTYTPAADAFGTATITVRLSDDGGTADGGVNTSTPQTFTITVTGVNDEPSFTLPAPADQTSAEDAGPQTVNPFATGISAGPGETQVLTFTLTSTAPALFSAGPAIDPVTGVLTYTAAPDQSGSATVTVVLSDDGGTVGGGDDTSAAQTFDITVTAVNDAPVNVVPGPQTILEDTTLVLSGPNAISVSDVDAGAGPLSVTVSVTTGTMTFAASGGGTLTGNGTGSASVVGTPTQVNAWLDGLTYTPAANDNGGETLTVTSGDGGEAGTGGPMTDVDTVAIMITPVNDAPSFTKGPDQGVPEDSGVISVNPWATAISAGPNEGGQTVNFVVSNDNTALFAAQPAVSPAGVLTFTSAVNQFGVAEVTLRIMDDGGTTDGGVNQSPTQTFTITVTAVNDPPTSTGRAFGPGSLQANMLRSIPAVDGLLQAGSVADASDVAGNASYVPTFTVGTINGVAPVAGTITSTIAGVGTVVANATTGAFTIDPAAGQTGAVSFPYTVCDAGEGTPASACSAPATASFTIAGPVIWFVDASATGAETGSLTEPFNTLAEAVTAIGASTGERVFLYGGSYGTGITLNTSGWLVGQQATGVSFDALMMISPPAGTTTRPPIGTGTATVGNTVSLASSSVVRGVAITTTGANAGLTDPAAATTGVTVAETAITTVNGTAVDLDGVTGSLSFGRVVKSGTGPGIELTGNAGGTFAFVGGMAVTSGASPAFTAIGGGTVTVTQDNTSIVNTLTTTTGTALTVTGTTIGASGITFRSISSNGAASGIVLNATGISGGLTVTGNSSGLCGGQVVVQPVGTANTVTAPAVADCTGGTISGTTGNAVSLINTANVSLTRMRIHNNLGSGILGDDVTNLSLISSVLANNSDTATGVEANLRANEILGNAAITNSTIEGAAEDEIRLTPSSGTLTNLAISGTVIGNDFNDGTEGCLPCDRGNGITISPTVTASMTVNLTNSVIKDVFGAGIVVNGQDTTPRTFNMSNTTISDPIADTAPVPPGGVPQQFGGVGISLQGSFSADLTFNVSNNTFLGLDSNAINFSIGTTATNNLDVLGTIANNVIGNATTDSGSRDAIGIAMESQGDADTVVFVTNNVIQHTDQQGFFAQSRLGNAMSAGEGRFDLILRDNSTGAIDDNTAVPFAFQHAYWVDSRNASTLCLDAASNDAGATVGGAAEFMLRNRDTSFFLLERFDDGDGNFNETITNTTTVQNFNNGQNDAPTSTLATLTGTFRGFNEAPDNTCRSAPTPG